MVEQEGRGIEKSHGRGQKEIGEEKIRSNRGEDSLRNIL